jgi:anti-sigma28 factor (negative regulator of flagellin synthesis)
MSTENEKISPFDILKTINESKRNLIKEGELKEKEYTSKSFIVNKGLSLFPDTIFLANMMNINYMLSPQMQYEFYLTGVRKKKRFGSWPKSNDKTSEDFEIVQEYYRLNKDKTNEILSILTNEQINQIKKKINKGGLEN